MRLLFYLVYCRVVHFQLKMSRNRDPWYRSGPCVLEIPPLPFLCTEL